MRGTKIQWCWMPGYIGETWNPWTGCTKVSTGCKYCYAETNTNRWGKQKFTDVIIHPERFDKPLHWKKPRMIFVNSMSDMFHEDVPFEVIKQIFDITSKCRRHIFQILTKRPERMLEFAQWMAGADDISIAAWSRNVWLGVSVEDQETADERIPKLRQTPAAVRFLSVEPLLDCIWDIDLDGIDWVIIGGESGPKARPMNLEWVRSIIDQCKESDVPVFVKQLGTDWARKNNAKHNKGGDMTEWDKEFQIQEYPKGG